MIQFVLAAIVGGVLGKKFYPQVVEQTQKLAQQKSGQVTKPASGSSHAIQFMRESILQEEPVVLATEDVPLDNRFGNKTLVSEHEFIRTATIGLTMEQEHDSVTTIKSDLWSLLEAVAQEKIRKSQKIELGSQISRRVKVIFSTEPGKLVHYKVIWKQDSRRGVFDVKIDDQIYSIPYVVTFGLSHAIESIAGREGTN